MPFFKFKNRKLPGFSLPKKSSSMGNLHKDLAAEQDPSRSSKRPKSTASAFTTNTWSSTHQPEGDVENPNLGEFPDLESANYRGKAQCIELYF